MSFDRNTRKTALQTKMTLYSNSVAPTITGRLWWLVIQMRLGRQGLRWSGCKWCVLVDHERGKRSEWRLRSRIIFWLGVTAFYVNIWASRKFPDRESHAAVTLALIIRCHDCVIKNFDVSWVLVIIVICVRSWNLILWEGLSSQSLARLFETYFDAVNGCPRYLKMRSKILNLVQIWRVK